MSSGSPAQDDLGHGPRLSEREYERRIVELYSGLPPSPGKQLQEHIRRCELDLNIDCRLGRDFPHERREALWDIQQRIEKNRFRLILPWLFHSISYKWLHQDANKLARHLVEEYSKVLTKEELEAYFGSAESKNPILPLDKP